MLGRRGSPHMTRWPARGNRLRTMVSVAVATATLAGTVAAAAPAGAAATSPDAFYRYTGKAPLATIAPGTVLKTRRVPYHLAGVPIGLTATQLLYRSTGQLGQPTVNV